jgi:MFS-type transporter involved in bile tolerance (Atg22 family)
MISNELQRSDNAKYLKADSIKSLMTDQFLKIVSKFVHTRSINNVSNFLFAAIIISPLRMKMEME